MANTTSNLKLRLPSTSDRGWGIPLDNNFVQIDGLAPLGNLVVTLTESPSTTLRVSVAAGGYVSQTGNVSSFSGYSGYTVPANAYTYLWLTDSGMLASGTAWPSNVSIVRLAQINSGSMAIIAIVDARVAYSSVGAGVSAGASTGSSYVTLAADPNLTNERVLTGTTKQVIVTDGGAGNAVTLSLPQAIDSTATPTFAGATLTGPLVLAGQRTIVSTKTANYTAVATDSVLRLDASGGGFTVTLPTGAAFDGMNLYVKKVDTTANAISFTSAAQIDNSSNFSLSSYGSSRKLIYDATSNTWGLY